MPQFMYKMFGSPSVVESRPCHLHCWGCQGSH